MAVQRDYPQAERLPLPANIDSAESINGFSPLRNRDITSSAISVHHSQMIGIDVTLDQMKPEIKTDAIKFNDPHIESYDPQAACNLSSIMQSTVPEPFEGNNKFSHFNMPGANWAQQTKYLSHELNSSHYTQLRQELRSGWYSMTEGMNKSRKSSVLNRSLLNSKRLFDHHHFFIINKRFISLSSNHFNEKKDSKILEPEGELPKKETGASKLKKLVKEYGISVMVFHVGISLTSLGLIYGLVSR